MVRHAWFSMTLLSDAVISESSASAGAHGALPYIPGAVILGAASRLYAGFDEATQQQVFHAGSVRFSDALPLGHDNGPTLPLPFSLHYPKGKSATEGVINLACGSWDDALGQRKQVRDGHVDQAGQMTEPALRLHQKTAVDMDRQRAEDAQLFAYESLAVGQVFLFSLSADQDVEGATWSRLTGHFADTTIRIGRSRSAEFGCARVAAVAQPPSWPCAIGSGPGIVLWLASDLALVDCHGQPKLVADGADFGFPHATIDWSRSFVRHRSYTPYNGYRRALDMERQVLSRGSVLTLRADTVDASALTRLAESGAGLYRECGLGRIIVNADFLAKQRPALRAVAVPSRAGEEVSGVAPAAWLDILAKRSARLTQRRLAESEGERQGRAIAQLYDQAARLAGGDVGPGPSQWSALRAAADGMPDVPRLHPHLFDDEHGICRANDGDWGRFVALTGAETTFSLWLAARFSEAENDAPLVMSQIARQAEAFVRQRRSQ